MARKLNHKDISGSSYHHIQYGKVNGTVADETPEVAGINNIKSKSSGHHGSLVILDKLPGLSYLSDLRKPPLPKSLACLATKYLGTLVIQQPSKQSYFLGKGRKALQESYIKHYRCSFEKWNSKRRKANSSEQSSQ